MGRTGRLSCRGEAGMMISYDVRILRADVNRNACSGEIERDELSSLKNM